MREAPNSDRAPSGPTSQEAEVWELRLYVTGLNPKCLAAYSRIKKLCEEYIPGRYRIAVIDLLENPQLAEWDEVVAIPTLVRRVPAPIRKVVGDLADTELTIAGLQLRRIAP